MSDFLVQPASAAGRLFSETLPAKPGASQGASGEEFKDLLAVLLLGFTVSGPSQGGFSFGAQLAPLMLNLIEQLLARQVEEEAGEEPVEAGPSSSGLPVTGRLTQDFHAGHPALDIAIPVGTPVRAAMGGEVVFAGWSEEGYGNLVVVESGPYRAYYAHLSQIPVAVGQVVQAGAVIGLSGNTGRSTGPHLHYEVRANGQPVDPRGLAPPA